MQAELKDGPFNGSLVEVGDNLPISERIAVGVYVSIQGRLAISSRTASYAWDGDAFIFESADVEAMPVLVGAGVDQ